MPAALHIRHNAVSGLRRFASAEPLLPFLYNTRTIRTQYTDALSDLEAQEKGRSRRDGRTGERNPHSRRSYQGRRTVRDWDVKKPNFDQSGAQHDEAVSSDGPGYEHQRHMRLEHVPFEHAAQMTESVGEGIRTSTMTPAEKKAFEELLSLQHKKDPFGGDELPDELPDKLHGVLAEAVRGRQNSEARDLPGELEDMKNTMSEEDAHTLLLNQATRMDNEQVDKAFAEAQTDVELWKTLHDKVLSRVAALNLDGPPAALPSSHKRKTKASQGPKAPADSATSPWKGGITDEAVITRGIARHLVYFQKALLYSFPASQLSVSLLPYLKTLGPTTFALAVGSTLYNFHIRALWRLNADLPSIVNTLDEMEKQVIDLNERTSITLDIVIKKARTARAGVYGPGMEAVWSGERFRKMRMSFAFWRKQAEARMQEKALKEARDKEDNPVRIVTSQKRASE
ncbi:hypothetical protein Q7P37_003242 [Cladosporium fusiforme]